MPLRNYSLTHSCLVEAVLQLTILLSFRMCANIAPSFHLTGRNVCAYMWPYKKKGIRRKLSKFFRNCCFTINTSSQGRYATNRVCLRVSRITVPNPDPGDLFINNCFVPERACTLTQEGSAGEHLLSCETTSKDTLSHRVLCYTSTKQHDNDRRQQRLQWLPHS